MKPRDKSPQAPSKDVVEVTRLKGSGPGGQNRNKRETGIRIKHLPSGVVVTATERRSQGQNLQTAFDRLEQRLQKLSHRPKPRKKTGPTGASKRKRLQGKKIHGERKRQRSRRSFDD